MVDINVQITPSMSRVGHAIGGLDYTSFLRNQINIIAFKVESFAKQLTPVGKTGHLKGRIFTSPATNILQAVISTNVDYAIFVHDGTRYMRARPFMTQGAKSAQQNIEGEIGRKLDAEYVQRFKTL